MSKRNIYLTVDVECHNYDNQDRYFWGRTADGEQWGLKKILDLGKELDIPINFFVDLPEAHRYGNELLLKVINLIKSYGQPVYLHLHPNYISGDETRTFLWQYNTQEKKEILEETHKVWKELIGTDDCKAFRAGRYGVDAEIYDLLKEEFGEGLIDLSYCTTGRADILNKMCHLPYNEVASNNKPLNYNGIYVLPNTRYIGFDFCNKFKTFNLDAAESCIGEFKRIIEKTKLHDVIITMHSWNFIKVFFFNPQKIYKDFSAERRFKKMVVLARRNSFEFCRIEDFSLTPGNQDELLSLCDTTVAKTRSLWYNFVRFQRTARLSKKYFILFTCFYSFIAIALILLFILTI